MSQPRESSAPPPGPRWGSMAVTLTCALITLAVFLGSVAGIIWLLAEPVAETWQQWRSQARRAPDPSPRRPALVMEKRLSLEEVLALSGPASDEHLAVLREGEQEHVKEATEAVDAGHSRNAMQAWSKVGDIRRRLRQWRSAASAYSYAVHAARDLLDDENTERGLHRQHIQCTLHSAQCLFQARKLTDADSQAQQAVSLGNQATGMFPLSVEFPAQIAQANALRAEIARWQGQDADEHTRAAVQQWQRILRLQPEHITGHTECGRVLLEQGTHHFRTGNAKQAQDYFRSALEELEAGRRTAVSPAHHLLLGLALFRNGQTKPALETIQPLQEQSDPDLLYGLACFYAQISDSDKLASGEQQEMAATAVRLLHRVDRADGFRDPDDFARLKNDPALAPLRTLPDFQRLQQAAQTRVRPRPLLET